MCNFAIKRGLNSQLIEEASKCERISQAAHHLKSEQKATVRHLSVASQLNRREVTRIYKDSEIKAPRTGETFRARSRWQTDKDYLGKYRKPTTLSHGSPCSQLYTERYLNFGFSSSIIAVQYIVARLRATSKEYTRRVKWAKID